MKLSEEFKIDYAKQSDLMDVFYLANDSLTRKNSINQSVINLSEHIKWFENKILSNDCIFYTVRTKKNEFAGYIRFDRDLSFKLEENIFIVSISLSAPFRGKGLGVTIINYCCELIFEKFTKTTIIAYIKKENIPSYKSFLKAGFVLLSVDIVKNIDCFKLELAKI